MSQRRRHGQPLHIDDVALLEMLKERLRVVDRLWP